MSQNSDAPSIIKPANFAQSRIVCFESRMADVMTQAILKFDGIPISAPAVQEVPLKNNPEAYRFAEKLDRGEFDAVVFMTGVGTRFLFDVLTERDGTKQFLRSLRKTTVVARGPKPLKVLQEFQIPAAIQVPEPNTWREILEALETHESGIPLRGSRIAIQEYGVSSEAFVDALRKKGALVHCVPVYRWALPDNLEPLKNAIHEIISGKVQFAFFTSAVQVRHLLKVATELGLADTLRRAIKDLVVVSVGPTTSEVLVDEGFPVDFEPSHPKMGQMVSECAKQAHELLKTKTASAISWAVPLRAADAGVIRASATRAAESLMVMACHSKKVTETPVWLMRQAGRYMKEYREVRRKMSFLELCKNSEACAQVTLMAVEKLKVDAAIIFSDLLLILEPLGYALSYGAEEGPVIDGPKSHLENPEISSDALMDHLSYVFDALRLTRTNLDPRIPLIGFAGAPFTLASYVIEGGSSKTFIKTKQVLYRHPEVWHRLMSRLTEALILYSKEQIHAGADIIQIFDSWVGCLGPEDYRKFVFPYVQKLFNALPEHIPSIHFGTGNPALLPIMKEAGGRVIGIDFRIDLKLAWDGLGSDTAVQGNMDPALLFGSEKEIRNEVTRILESVKGRPGHIFNLGHGILPDTPFGNVTALVQMVHEISRGFNG